MLGTGFATPSGAARIIDFLNSQVSQEGEGETQDSFADRPASPNKSGNSVQEQQRFAVHDGLFASAYQRTNGVSLAASSAGSTRPVHALSVGQNNQTGDVLVAGKHAHEVEFYGATAARRSLRTGPLGDLIAPLDSVSEDVLRELTREAGLDLDAVDQSLTEIVQ